MFGSMQLVQEVSSTNGRRSKGSSETLDEKHIYTIDNSINMGHRTLSYNHISSNLQSSTLSPTLDNPSSHYRQDTFASTLSTLPPIPPNRSLHLQTESSIARVSSFPFFPYRSSSYSYSHLDSDSKSEKHHPTSDHFSSQRYSKFVEETQVGDDLASSEIKHKSHKLLCLWPLPIITRYIITLSVIISTLNSIGLLQLSSSAPIYVLYRHEYVSLLASPFLFDFNMHSILFFAWNMLILGLFEESLTHVLGGTQMFVNVLFGMAPVLFILRNAFGYIFSKSTGFAVPILFFSESLHESSSGKDLLACICRHTII